MIEAQMATIYVGGQYIGIPDDTPARARAADHRDREVGQ
jgi:hypothetical protein